MCSKERVLFSETLGISSCTFLHSEPAEFMDRKHSRRWLLTLGLLVLLWVGYIFLPLLASVYTWVRNPKVTVVGDVEIRVPFAWVSGGSGAYAGMFRKLGRTVSQNSFVATILITNSNYWGPINDPEELWSEVIKKISAKAGSTATRLPPLVGDDFEASCAEWQNLGTGGMYSVCFVRPMNLLFEYSGSRQDLGVFYNTVRSIKRRPS